MRTKTTTDPEPSGSRGRTACNRRRPFADTFQSAMAAPKTPTAPSTSSKHATTVGDAGDGADQISTQVLRQFRLVFNAIKTHFQQVEKQAGVGGAQVWALSVIRDQPGIGVNELARAMDVRQPTASNLVRTLVEQDLAEVRKDDRDRRAVQLFVRPGGSRVLKRAPGPFAGVLPQALANLDRETLQRLEVDLAKLIDGLGADAAGAKIPLGQNLGPAPGRAGEAAYLPE